MALKKGIFENYITQKATPIKQKPFNDKYSKNKVFDNPIAQTIKVKPKIKTVNKPYTEKETNRNQIVNKVPESVNKPYTEKETNRNQTVNKVPESVNKPYTKEETNRNQAVINTIDKRSISMIFGLQRSIILTIHKNCIVNKQDITSPITLEYMANSCKTTTKTAKTIIQRLVKADLIKRVKSQNGRGGWTIYKLEPTLFRSVLHEEKIHELSIETVNKPYTKQETTPLTSSSSNITTTELPNEWKNINLDGLSDYGFGNNHIQQIAKLGILAPEDLQQSIDYFVFDLLENNKASEIKKSPVAFFMGILRGKGLYTAPPNYESIKDRVLRLKTEQLDKQREKREKMEAELIQAEFKIWVSGITFEEKEKLMPEEVKNSRFSAEKEGFFRTYFKEKFWPSIQQERSSPKCAVTLHFFKKPSVH